MWPLVVIAAFSAAKIAYDYFKDDDKGKTSDTPPTILLGNFAVWGRPNSGKTTFINQLLEKTVDPATKTATTSQSKYSKIPPKTVDEKIFRISEIIDMPGTKDRLDDWLKLVASQDHVFYIVNLRRIADSDYQSEMRSDLAATVDALRASSKAKKRIHMIASHVDESQWKDIDPAEVNNKLQENQHFRMQYESMEGVAGYVYAADLTNQDSFMRLQESIIRDCHA
jgi:GTPase Era involved in 16S rRNA processing